MERGEKGRKVMEEVFGSHSKETRPAFKAMMDLTSEHLFGDVWSREALPLRDRSLITVALLAGAGQLPQLRTHLKGALNLGLSADALREVMIHVAHYRGWPTGMNGLKVLEEVVAEQGHSFSDT